MNPRYGWHGRFMAQPGQGNALAEILLATADGLRANDACLLHLDGFVYVPVLDRSREALDAVRAALQAAFLTDASK